MMELDGSKAYVLSRIKTALHEAVSLDVLFQIQDDLLELVDAERLTLYACDQITIELVSKVKTGAELDEIRLPINFENIPGFAAAIQQPVNVSNVEDKKELSAIDKRLTFDRTWDEKTGFKTKQMLCHPIIYGNRYILGVLQFLNCKGSKSAFDEQDEILTEKVCASLALVIQKYVTVSEDASGAGQGDVAGVLKKYGVPAPEGVRKAVEALILEHRELKERMRRYREVFEGV